MADGRSDVPATSGEEIVLTTGALLWLVVEGDNGGATRCYVLDSQLAEDSSTEPPTERLLLHLEVIS